MLFTKKRKIEDYIIEILLEKPYFDGVLLVQEIQKIRPNTVKQTVYTALKFLLKEEVVSKIKGKYYISKLWINKLSIIIKNFELNNYSDSIFKLHEKDYISFSFPSLMICDTYWAHIFDILTEWIDIKKPITVWNPHEWFIIGRSKEEQEIFQNLNKNNKHAYYTIGGKTDLDQKFKKEFTSKNLQIHIGEVFSFKENYYLNIFDCFIIEVFINKKLAQHIEYFYKNNKVLNEINIKEFENIISQKFPVRMKITKNSLKARKIQNKLLKNFL